MALITKLISLRSACLRIPIVTKPSNTPLNLGSNYFTKFRSQIRLKSMFPKFTVHEAKLKAKDNIPDHFNLIYRNTMSNYLLGAQIVSVLSAAIVGVTVFYYEISMKDYEPHFSGWKEQPASVNNELIVYITAILLLSVMMQYFIKKMPLRIYNCKDEKYVFVYYNVLPFHTRRFTCGINDIRKLADKPNSVLPWTNSRYEVHKNFGAILLESFFKNSLELNIMLGNQKRYVEPED